MNKAKSRKGVKSSMAKRHCILEVTADTMEYIVNIFDSFEDCVKKTGLTRACIARRIQLGIEDKNKHTKFVSCWLEPEERPNVIKRSYNCNICKHCEKIIPLTGKKTVRVYCGATPEESSKFICRVELSELEDSTIERPVWCPIKKRGVR